MIKMKQYTDLAFSTFNYLTDDIYTESRKQIDKWGIQTHSLFEWQNYLTEELGELASAIAEFEYRKGSKEEIYKESIQVVTLALKIAEMVKHDKHK